MMKFLILLLTVLLGLVSSSLANNNLRHVSQHGTDEKRILRADASTRQLAGYGSKTPTSHITLILGARLATPLPPVGPALHHEDIDVWSFCSQFNERTKHLNFGTEVSVVITLYDDQSFSLVLYQMVEDPILFNPVRPDESKCSSDFPCQRCEGDCDTDGDCADGLVCYHKGQSQPVPGCTHPGGALDASRSDWCIPKGLIIQENGDDDETDQPKDDDDRQCGVLLVGFGDFKQEVIKMIGLIMGVGPKDAQSLVDLPMVVKEGLTRETASEIKGSLEAVGGKALVIGCVFD